MKRVLPLGGSMLLLVGLFLAGNNVASADTFNYNGYGVANEQNISIQTPNNIAGGVGQIQLYGSGANAGHNIYAYCMDIYTYLQGSGTYNVGSLTTAGTGGSNPTLTSMQIREIGTLIVEGNSLISSMVNASAAIQLAIWKIEYSNFVFTGLSSAVTNLASTYLTNVGAGGIWASYSYNVSLLTESGDQSLVFVDQGGYFNTDARATPIPAALPLFASGLGVMGLLARRRKKKDAAVTA